MDVFDLFAKLSLDTSNYDKGLDSAEKSSSNFGQNLKKGLTVAAGLATAALAGTATAAVVGTKKFLNAAKATAQAGDNIDKSSQKVGFSKKAWQEWDYVLNLAGSSMSSATMGIKAMTNQVDKAKKGNKDAVAEFKALGISVKDLKKMSREEIFGKVISGLQKMPESSKRAALANKVLGRSGQDLSAVFNMTEAETKQAIKTANDYGMVLDDKAVKASANFQDSLTTLQGTMTGLKNNMMSQFLPSLTTVMDGLAKVFSGKGTKDGMKQVEVGIMSLVSNLQTKMPQFLELGKTIILSVLKGFTPMLPSLVSTIFDIGIQAITTVSSMLPQMMPIIISGIQNALSALLTALPIIISGLSQLVMGIVNWLAEPSNVKLLVSGIVQLCTQIVNSISTILPVLLPAIVTILSELAKAITEPSNMQIMIDSLLTLIGALAVAIGKSAPILAKAILAVIKNLANLLSKFFEWAVPIAAKGFEGIVNTYKAFGNGVKTFVLNLINGIKDKISTWITNLKKGFSDGFNAIKTNIGNIISGIGTFISNLISKIKEIPSKAKSIGSDIVKGLWNGISNMAKWIKSKIDGFGKGVLNKLKDFFKIKSPSRVFRDEIGKYLAMGLGEGFTDEMPNVIGDMQDSMSGITADLNASLAPASSTSSASTFNAGGFTVNVYGSEGQDVRELAKAVSQEIQNMIADKEKAYA